MSSSRIRIASGDTWNVSARRYNRILYTGWLKRAACFGRKWFATTTFPREYATVHESSVDQAIVPAPGSRDVMTEILRAGAQKMLAQMIQQEVEDWLVERAHLRDEQGRRQVVRNGYLPEREITTGVGLVKVQQPRVRDRRPADQAKPFSSKILPPEAKHKLHQIWMADTREHACEAFELFVKIYRGTYPKAVECLVKDRDALLAFYDFPAEHWIHLRTTNPIESSFATVRLRTKKAKGSGSRVACLTMVYKLMQSAATKWRLLNASELIPDVIPGVPFVDGIKAQDTAA